jgi:surfeit locus 1 family protein
MLRTALRPQWLAALVLVLLMATGMSLLGRWQLDRARQHGAQEAQREAPSTGPRPIGQVIQPRVTFPRDAVGARVEVSGQWDGARRLLIADRELAGRNGFWVLVPLRLPDGSAVGVVRGWVASATDPVASVTATPADTTVRVTGLLQPTEPPPDRTPGQGTGLPADQFPAIAVTDLINAWPYPLVTGYVLAQQEQSADGGPLAGPVPQRIPPPPIPTGLDWRNLAYAVQWWLFAGFGLFMWWRLVRDDHQSRIRPQPPPGAGPAPGTAADLTPDDTSAPTLARGVAP